MNFTFGLSLVLVFFYSRLTDARRCYICGIGSNEPFMNIGVSELAKRYNNNSHTSPTPLSCTEFERSRSSSASFIRNCPMGYNGCITQMDGSTGNVMRACEILPLNDCKTANNIAYCYCDKDLCNYIKESTIKRQQFSQIQNHERYTNDGVVRQQPTDDEDLNGGSGSHEIHDKHDSNENAMQLESTTIFSQLYREHIEPTIKYQMEETLNKPPAPNRASHAMLTLNSVLLITLFLPFWLHIHRSIFN